jgi:uncharacterized protein (TIGR02285 family)
MTIAVRLWLLFAATLMFSASPLMAEESITWLEAVAPPFFIHEGPLKGQGYEDLLTQLLIAELPNYQHRRMRASITRHYQQFKQGEKACSLAMYRTPEREEFSYFSIPSVFTLPVVLIIQKERFGDFGGKKTVDLTEILKSNAFVVGRSNNRSYGHDFDNILNTYGTPRNIFAYEGPELSRNLFQMLLAGRIDALPGLPEEAMYLAETLDIRDKIMTLEVTENISNYDGMITYVACSKTPWGQKTIADINRALQKIRPTAEYEAAYERWLDPSSVENYRTLYRQVFLQK